MDMYKAAQLMKSETACNRTFSVTFFTYNRYTGVAGGVRHVRRAIVRKEAKSTDLVHSKYKMFLYDMDTQLPFTAWLPLLKIYNGIKIEI